MCKLESPRLITAWNDYCLMFIIYVCCSDVNDHRLHWLENVFVPHLEQWRKKNSEKFGASALEKSFLSKQTFQGLCNATKGMVSLVRCLIKLNFSCVATRRISQDSLESYFGYQRAFGRRHENPSIHQFGYRNNAIVLRRQLHYTVSSARPLKKRRVMRS